MGLPDFFFERVSADILQRMDGILALAEQLGRHRLTDDAQACVAGVTESAASVRRIMDCALDLRSVSLQGLRLAAAPVALRELMDEVQARWQPRAADAAMTLLISYAGDPDATVMADRERLHQIFDGFIAEAAGSHGRGAVEAGLHVETREQGVVLSCRIRGGRDAAWQAMDLETRIRHIADRHGLEVALSAMLARRVLSKLSGELKQEADAGASETTIFELTLPGVQAAEAASTAAPARVAHVLVVDDNATNRMVAQSLVEMFDCTSESAEDGLEAIEAVRTGRFDLILMDIRMPRMDGVTATREIRALAGSVGRTPIIALTANADPEDAQGYIAAGMNGVVEKPMKPEQLLYALQQALSTSAAAAAA